VIKLLTEILKDFTWSFSRLNSFHQCKYQFKLQYIDQIKGENNFFAEYGSFIHNLLEQYAKGELESYELLDAYNDGYFAAIQHPAPPNKYVDLGQSYYQSGIDYFTTFDGFDYEIIGVEKKLSFEIDGLKLIGFYDLLGKDTEGNLHVIDHKSGSFSGAKDKKAEKHWNQLHLYSLPVKEEYGKYPTKLHINAFRKQNWLTMNFQEDKIQEIKDWVVDTVEQIKREEKWLPKSDGFFCNFLCNFRNICEYKPQEI